MSQQYTASLWPPLAYPSPTPYKDLWNAQATPSMGKGLALTLPTPYKDIWAAQASPSQGAGPRIVQPTPYLDNWTPVAAPNPAPPAQPATVVTSSLIETADPANPITTKAYVPPNRTQTGINTLFKIVDQNILGQGL